MKLKLILALALMSAGMSLCAMEEKTPTWSFWQNSPKEKQKSATLTTYQEIGGYPTASSLYTEIKGRGLSYKYILSPGILSKVIAWYYDVKLPIGCFKSYYKKDGQLHVEESNDPICEKLHKLAQALQKEQKTDLFLKTEVTLFEDETTQATSTQLDKNWQGFQNANGYLNEEIQESSKDLLKKFSKEYLSNEQFKE